MEESGVSARAELIAQVGVVEHAAEGGVELGCVVEAEGGAGLGGDFGEAAEAADDDRHALAEGFQKDERKHLEAERRHDDGAGVAVERGKARFGDEAEEADAGVGGGGAAEFGFLAAGAGDPEFGVEAVVKVGEEGVDAFEVFEPTHVEEVGRVGVGGGSRLGG